MTKVDNEGEFAAYVEGHLTRLRKIAYLLCQDWHRADDLTQTALTGLYVHWRRASAVSNLDAYVRAMLVNAFLAEQRTSWWKRTSTHPETDQVSGFARPGETPDLEGFMDLRAALGRLPAKRRATVVLRYYCDLSVEATADLLGCSPGTVKSQTSKALAQLRVALDPVPTPLPGSEPGPFRAAGPARPAPQSSYPIIPSVPGSTR